MPGPVQISVFGTGNQAPATSGANAPQTLTYTGIPGRRWHLRAIILFGSAASTATLTVQDGATVILNFGTVTVPVGATPILLGDPGFFTSVGNNLVINVGAAGVANTTTISAVCDLVS